MICAAKAPFAFTPTSLWRTASVSLGALVFGIVAAPVLPMVHWAAAAVLGSLFGILFLSGAGHSILRAVALRDAGLFRPANWSDGVTAAAGGTLAASAAMLFAGSDPSPLLLGLGLALGAAYVPAKLGCIEAGCCAAGHHRHRLDPGFDLRLFEALATLVLLAFAAVVALFGAQAWAAAAALGGHLAVRLHSRAVRGRHGGGAGSVPPIGLEVAPLALSTLLSAGIALAG